MGWLVGSGRSHRRGNGHPLQYSSRENFMDWGAWWATVHGVAKSQMQLSTQPRTGVLTLQCCTWQSFWKLKKNPKGQPRWRTRSLGHPVSFLHLLLVMSCHPRGHVKVPSLTPTYVWVRPLITFTEPGSVFSEHTAQFAIGHSWVWYLLLSPDCDGWPSRWAPILSTSWYSDPMWPLPTMHWYQFWILWPTAYGRSDGRPPWRLDFKGCPGGPVAKTSCSQCRGAGFNLA